MSKKDTSEGAAPTKGKKKTIIIDEVECTYSFSRLVKEEGMLLELAELKNDKNITFIYQTNSTQITKDI